MNENQESPLNYMALLDQLINEFVIFQQTPKACMENNITLMCLKEARMAQQERVIRLAREEATMPEVKL